MKEISLQKGEKEGTKKLTRPSISLAFLSDAAADLIACSTAVILPASPSDVWRPFPHRCKLRLGWRNNEHPRSSVCVPQLLHEKWTRTQGAQKGPLHPQRVTNNISRFLCLLSFNWRSNLAIPKAPFKGESPFLLALKRQVQCRVRSFRPE